MCIRDRILTFSNAAAAELRARLAQGLEQQLRQKPGDRLLQGQALRLQRASISTVSAFCMQLLREYFSQLDIPPDFTVADEAEIYQPVSYTHLDVYKRQVQPERGAAAV